MKNRLGFIKKEMESIYEDTTSEATKKFINKHYHWVKGNKCSICGEKVNKELE